MIFKLISIKYLSIVYLWKLLLVAHQIILIPLCTPTANLAYSSISNQTLVEEYILLLFLLHFAYWQSVPIHQRFTPYYGSSE